MMRHKPIAITPVMDSTCLLSGKKMAEDGTYCNWLVPKVRSPWHKKILIRD